MGCRKCQIHFNREQAAMFIVQGELTPLDNKYALVQFRRAVEVTYNSAKRKFHSSEVVNLPYPLINQLIQAETPSIVFRNPQQELVFNQVYNRN